jgi:hypothetical protein
MTLAHWSRFAIAALMVAGCGAAGPVASPIPPTTMASPSSSSGSSSSEVPACPNFVEVVETGPLPGDDGTEDGPLARAQQRLSGDIDAAVAYGAEHADEYASIRYENGPRVRIVIGFTAHVDEHCAALRELLEYPDEFEIILQPATEARLDEIMNELVGLAGDRMRSVGRGAGVVHLALRADGESVAAEVLAAYGGLVEITVGMLPYPDRFSGDPLCGPLIGPIAVDAPLVAAATLDGDTVRSGQDFRGTITVRNVGADVFDFQSGPTQSAVVFRRGADAPSGFYTGGMDDIGYGARLAPGESVELKVIGGTASCDPALGYALPPGEYEVSVPVVLLTMHENAPTEVSYVLSGRIPLTVVP